MNIPEPGVEMVWLSSTRRGEKNILANDADANEKNFSLSQGNAVATCRSPHARQCSGRPRALHYVRLTGMPIAYTRAGRNPGCVVSQMAGNLLKWLAAL
ncbi:hypothetical protein PQQ87_08450 [Paraburkholderia nemoris]|uniref:hypothetical protein n=1 Tax=Paraburkholderia nemoris TaxID=2793076 RepID=UPI0038B75FFA